MRTRERLVIATLNTRGTPVRRSQLAGRYGAIGAAFEASDVDIVNVQEVHSYYHLHLLKTAMPSYGEVNYRPSLLGPAGGLVTFVRGSVAARGYHRLPIGAGLEAPRWSRAAAPFKGMLLTRLDRPGVWLANTHLLANYDGDWSDDSRFTPVHQGQLESLARMIQKLDDPIIMCGDFNVARESSPFEAFCRRTGLVDAFAGHCPPTFHSEYLEAGKTAHCIDFMLLRGLEPTSAEQIFTDKVDLPGGPTYLSDHVGLRAIVVT
ncbi:endonuclease/exonuclease/phosphatase family protein [Kribbella sp. ALI-6-A]|uniref:endonuclease/exonuclease/phosphatase family protein n=1 Tax=Kribbella sp. ALI-6-A TaxID=1933817 RepID=UPI001EDA12CF|nr:endonuclease/exonuclease/phosphatase family protein [Kribbella sp. ALI-6-A]